MQFKENMKPPDPRPGNKTFIQKPYIMVTPRWIMKDGGGWNRFAEVMAIDPFALSDQKIDMDEEIRIGWDKAKELGWLK